MTDKPDRDANPQTVWLLGQLLLFCLLTFGIFSMQASVNDDAQRWGAERGRLEMKLEAIEAGAAEYVCDPETGKVEWRWKSQH